MSSVSAIFGVKIFSPNTKPASSSSSVATLRQSPPAIVRYGDGTGTGTGIGTIECSSRPQKKATAHHRKTRPKKTQPWDKNRGPAVYPPLPALPAEWSFAAVDDEAPPSSTPTSANE